ncbi:MAG: 50S ribosomal protein L18 [Candidatus Cloacimonetes bacterium]|nr:50S ribosomal protein L18 [Candidatus Cloacimonadota bacterium]
MKHNSITRDKYLARKRRVKHIRKRMMGTEDRPRLVIFRSLKNISGQIIDDTKGITLISYASNAKEMEINGSGKKVAQSFEVGKKLGELALAKGISKVCFDRAGYLYHGRVKAFAEGARKAGLDF